jgi:hypothetical protein
MGAEFLATMGRMGDGGGLYYHIDHDVTRTVAGDVESVRARLSDALEQVGYSVLNETPIQAKRSGSTAGATGCSNDILKYPASLTVGLKAAGANSTRVTFAYVVRHPYGFLTRGDRNTLDREAEAIVALANARAQSHGCPSCGAEVTGGVRFCRQCGAPAATATPAELELLQLTANANAGYKGISWGAFFMLLALLLPLLLFIASQDPVKFAKAVRVITIIAGALGGSGILMLLSGLWRLRKGVNQRIDRETAPPVPRRGAGAPDTAALPPPSAAQPVAHSVTDATTDLLPHEVKRIN